jgi:hypothetical protein
MPDILPSRTAQLHAFGTFKVLPSGTPYLQLSKNLVQTYHEIDKATTVKSCPRRAVL